MLSASPQFLTVIKISQLAKQEVGTGHSIQTVINVPQAIKLLMEYAGVHSSAGRYVLRTDTS